MYSICLRTPVHRPLSRWTISLTFGTGINYFFFFILIFWVLSIGGHPVRYPWSAILDWAWYRNVRYRTEKRRVRHYIGYWNEVLSDIRYPTLVNPRGAVVSCQLLVRRSRVETREENYVLHFVTGVIWKLFINFSYRNIRYWFSLISEWRSGKLPVTSRKVEGLKPERKIMCYILLLGL